MNTFRSLLTAALVTVAAPLAAHSQESGIEVGARAPGAVVETLDGRAFDIGTYIGKGPLLIEFWAFWCPSCKELEPSMMALQKKYAGKVRLLSVAVSVNETPERVKAYVARHKYAHETVFDAKGKAADAYDVPATSYVVVIDGGGRVIYTGQGGKQNLDAAINKALKATIFSAP